MGSIPVASMVCERSTTRVDSGRSLAISSSSTSTKWPLDDSYPRTVSLFDTSSSQCGHHFFNWMGVWHLRWSCRNATSDTVDVAGNTRIGIAIRLSLSDPFHVARAGAMNDLSAGDPSQVRTRQTAIGHGREHAVRLSEVSPPGLERADDREPVCARGEHVA